MHLLLTGIPREPYLTYRELWSFLNDAPWNIGMTRISPPVILQVPDGVTGLCVLAESHISVHYLHRRTVEEPIPEAGMVAIPAPVCFVDVFTCKVLPPQTAEYLTETLRLERAEWDLLDRGTYGSVSVPLPVSGPVWHVRPLAAGGDESL